MYESWKSLPQIVFLMRKVHRVCTQMALLGNLLRNLPKSKHLQHLPVKIKAKAKNELCTPARSFIYKEMLLQSLDYTDNIVYSIPQCSKSGWVTEATILYKFCLNCNDEDWIEHSFWTTFVHCTRLSRYIDNIVMAKTPDQYNFSMYLTNILKSHHLNFYVYKKRWTFPSRYYKLRQQSYWFALNILIITVWIN